MYAGELGGVDVHSIDSYSSLTCELVSLLKRIDFDGKLIFYKHIVVMLLIDAATDSLHILWSSRIFAINITPVCCVTQQL